MCAYIQPRRTLDQLDICERYVPSMATNKNRSIAFYSIKIRIDVLLVFDIHLIT